MNPSDQTPPIPGLDETSARLERRPAPAFQRLRDDLELSFEFFPPASEKGAANLWQNVRSVEPLRPSFVSVTYGAGGSTRERTHEAVKRILRDTSMRPAAHLTCVGASRAEVDAVIDAYAASGVRHIVALRGDPPKGQTRFQPHPGGYANAAELVAGITRRGRFEVSVAAYPEVHPEARSAAADLDNLKRKIDAGASRAITQFFFDPDVYLRFVDRARAAGISVPIVPGVLPIQSFANVRRFAERCGAAVPQWLVDLFTPLERAPELHPLVAATVAAEQCTRLIDRGITRFHFYTLNRTELSRAVCHVIGRQPTPMAALGDAVNQ